jgi:hypothetical protein
VYPISPKFVALASDRDDNLFSASNRSGLPKHRPYRCIATEKASASELF